MMKFRLFLLLTLLSPLARGQGIDAPFPGNAQKDLLAWANASHDPQHSSISGVPSQPLGAIHWQAPIDLQPPFGEIFIHYGSPLVTLKNTVIVSVKTGFNDGFRVEAHNGRNGILKWRLDSDYSVPFAFFTPPFSPVLVNGSVIFPAAGGTVLVRTKANDAQGEVKRLAFYGIRKFDLDPQAFSDNVRINTPITADHRGNIYFGFIVLGPTSNGLQSGLARIDRDGKGSWVSAVAASGDPAMTKINMGSAPALSPDEKHLYVGASNFDFGSGDLVELNAATLQLEHAVRLIDPASGLDAEITDSSSAAPTVGPDGDVYFGVLENPFPSHNDRGWLLHFSGDLQQQKTPGDFGWDDTASIIPVSMVHSYHGSSSYLIMTKYNNYAGVGGDGVNKLAILDPNATEPDFLFGNPVMNEVLTVTGVTPDPDFIFSFPGAVREWCINTAAVDPFRNCVLVNSEDGKLYRWSLNSNTLSEAITLTGGIGEAYTPTVIGIDGTVYAINRSVLFGIGTRDLP
jgi:hypothetical protein